MKKSKICVILGSHTDTLQMQGAFDYLDEMKVPYRLRILSAHRIPGELRDAVKASEAELFICAAGKAAHLAGVVASHTLKPVLAVPMETSMMGGLDSLLSTVQMPKGVPVACLGVGEHGAVNAAVLATQILAMHSPTLRRKLRKAKKAKRKAILRDDRECGDGPPTPKTKKV